MLSRTSRGRQQILVTNVDQIVIVASAAEPYLKPNLIDRFFITAEQKRACAVHLHQQGRPGRSPRRLQPLVGSTASMGYRVLVSAATGVASTLVRSKSGSPVVVAGQSGVGKSSLLNALDQACTFEWPVSETTQKGKHTTTTGRLFRLKLGGYVVDTARHQAVSTLGCHPREVAGYFAICGPTSANPFPNCTHSHEDDCAIKDAVADGFLDARRYESYLALLDERPA